MSNKAKSNLFLFLLLTVSFYVLPLLIGDTGSGMFILLLVMPVLTLILSAFFGWFNGFRLYYPLLVAVFFAPTVFLFYNESAWIYAVVYAGLALIGSGLGAWMQRRGQRRQQREST